MKNVNYSIVAQVNAKLFSLQEKMLKENNLSFFKELESLTKKYQSKKGVLNFDELREFINKLDESLPLLGDGYLGNYNVAVVSKKGSTVLVSLKATASNNEDLYGFGLNHYNYHFKNVKKSHFYNGDGAYVDIERNDFISAVTYENGLTISLISGTVHVSW